MHEQRVAKTLIPAIIVAMTLVFALPLQAVHAAPTTITGYKSQYAVSVNAPYQQSQWTDTVTFTEPTSGMTFAVKQNGTGWLFLMIWQQSSIFCYDQYCFGGIELGHLNNTQAMGSPSTPTIMILASTAFKNNVDEFISTGEQTPVSVESEGYKTQSSCGLTLSGGTYTAVCYRPFKLTDASPYDFPTLGVGSTVEIGFAVGEFSAPGDHSATDMSSYILTFSGSTYSSTESTTTTTATTTTSSSPSTTTTTTTTPTSTTTTTTSTTTPTTTTSTTVTSTTTTPSSVTTTASATLGLSVSTNSATYSGTQSGVISGTLSGVASPTGSVGITIINPSGNLVFSDAVSIRSGGIFNDTFHAGVNDLWTTGNYTVTATWTTLTARSTFSYAAPSPITTVTVASTLTTVTTQTMTSTVPTTLTQNVTATSTQTSTSTITQTTPAAVADWVYALVVVLLIGCVLVGYFVRTLIDSRRAPPK